MFAKWSPAQRKFAADLVILGVTQCVLFFGVKYLLKTLDPNHNKKKQAKETAGQIMARMGCDKMDLNEYEQIIASEIIWPEDLNVEFKDIGGLDDIIEELNESVIYPLIYPNLFDSVSTLLGPPKGVLLYGPPGNNL
jgi:SpoVK/Ycf46/Vps4 family AAA+-type ATPase